MNPSSLSMLAAVASAAVLMAVILQQCRKPSPGVGRVFLWLMNRSHADVTAWGLAHVTIAADATVLVETHYFWPAHEALLTATGFVDVAVHTDPAKGWV